MQSRDFFDMLWLDGRRLSGCLSLWSLFHKYRVTFLERALLDLCKQCWDHEIVINEKPPDLNCHGGFECRWAQEVLLVVFLEMLALVLFSFFVLRGLLLSTFIMYSTCRGRRSWIVLECRPRHEKN